MHSSSLLKGDIIQPGPFLWFASLVSLNFSSTFLWYCSQVLFQPCSAISFEILRSCDTCHVILLVQQHHPKRLGSPLLHYPVTEILLHCYPQTLFLGSAKLWWMSSWINSKVTQIQICLFRQRSHCHVSDTHQISGLQMNVAQLGIEIRFNVLLLFTQPCKQQTCVTFEEKDWF